MSEETLLQAWSRARMQLIISQLAPTFLLITTIGLCDEICGNGGMAVWATIGILFASGILGALVQFGAAADAQAIAADLAALGTGSRSAQSAISHARWLWVPKFFTPAVFVVIFVTLVLALNA